MKLIIILALLMLGCETQVKIEPVKTESQKKEERQVKFINRWTRILPEGAIDIVDLGNNWVKFTIEIEGRRRRFIFHRNTSRGYNHKGYGHESLSELKY